MPWVVRGEFRKLWIGQAVSAGGSAITTVALPLVAVVVLGATPFEMGLLTALTVLPHLLFGLPAGVWVDRLSLRRLLVVADVGRAMLLGTIPVLSACGPLRMEHLYLVALLAGVLTLLSDTASLTLLPSLVARDELMRANSAMMLTQNVASTTGPSAAGFLVQLLSAPFAIAFDALSFVVSAVSSSLLREPAGTPAAARSRVELTAGLRVLLAHPVLRPLTISATIGAMAGAMQGPLVVLYLVRGLHWSPALVGVAITVTGAASVIGAAVAPAYSTRLGLGRAYLSGQFMASLGGVLLASAATPLVFLAQLLGGLGMPLYGVPQRTLRQSLVPEPLLGQTTATWRTLVIGGQTLGALTSGLLAGPLGLRLTLVLSTTGMLLGTLPVALSPVRTLRQQASRPAQQTPVRK